MANTYTQAELGELRKVTGQLREHGIDATSDHESLAVVIPLQDARDVRRTLIIADTYPDALAEALASEKDLRRQRDRYRKERDQLADALGAANPSELARIVASWDGETDHG